MKPRFPVVAVVVAGVSLVASGAWSAADADPASPPPGTTCTWGGTPAAPTGTFTISPGVTTSVPLDAPSRFFVTGELAGDPGCTGTLTYMGQIDAGGTCLFATFEGEAAGIPGVTHFAGVGVGPFGPARLYDKDGKVVASENADVNTVDNIPHYLDCGTPNGFTGGNFSSLIVFVDQQ